ncbi:2-oxoacid:acceptor oxidoreductase family protein [Solidesulfovibrio magneticus]|uniref:2-oxoglutarate synthase subunit KorC n=1 Tax=Solidesulfovibrio magneticus (strain ATCC 700980 / DSM 13731 / RS-1) TaxID=573370 RepID=C4XQK5_SOLM1|nr:2-oxoacid:acceptor oxidoreductase family protein [Solidesulfovibrio magneticus]BAH75370.1 2-oxoglutarate synthase subunit KorC [Solidesulfovibrio magneticus RS-1]
MTGAPKDKTPAKPAKAATAKAAAAKAANGNGNGNGNGQTLARYEIRLSGLGGQGILTMGKLLGQALAIGHGYYVTQTQSYGPEARGGASRADLVVSSEPISYPKTEYLDLLVALSQEAAASYYSYLKPRGALLIDADLVRQSPSSVALALPFTRLAREKVGVPQATNVVALGAVAYLLPFARIEAMRKSLKESLPEKIREANIKALNLGYQEAKKRLGEPIALPDPDGGDDIQAARMDLTEIMTED